MFKIKENKILKFFGNCIYILLFTVILLIFIIVAVQRFSNNTISFAGIKIFNIATGSMKPVYEEGDVLLEKEIEPKDIEIGDDVTYLGITSSLNEKMVTHRIISKTQDENGKYKFITKGLANDLADPEISEAQIQGKVIYKSVILSFISKLINNIYTMYFIIFIPSAIVIFIILKTMYLIIKESKKDD